MTTRLRLHPALLCAVVGAALVFGVGAALPVWSVPYHYTSPYDLGGWSLRRGTLWEALAAAGDAPNIQQWRLDDLDVAASILAGGAGAGVLGWAAWDRLRCARRRAA